MKQIDLKMWQEAYNPSLSKFTSVNNIDMIDGHGYSWQVDIDPKTKGESYSLWLGDTDNQHMYQYVPATGILSIIVNGYSHIQETVTINFKCSFADTEKYIRDALKGNNWKLATLFESRITIKPDELKKILMDKELSIMDNAKKIEILEQRIYKLEKRISQLEDQKRISQLEDQTWRSKKTTPIIWEPVITSYPNTQSLDHDLNEKQDVCLFDHVEGASIVGMVCTCSKCITKC
jgi:hypothetical protein